MKPLHLDTHLRQGGFSLDVCLSLPGQGVSAIIGPSGSGKSTLIRMIAGLAWPQTGTIHVGESPWFDPTQGIRVPPQQRRIGMVFQDYALFEHMSVAQNIAYGVEPEQREVVVSEWIERLHLKGLAERYPAQLSGGQRQRVALARALAPQPELLLLDEPFSAVDAHLRQSLRCEIKKLMMELQQPVLLITHDMEDVRHLADHIGVMIDGRIRRFGEAHEVFDQPMSHEVAQVLGWRNFLPIRRLQHNKVSGDWGSVELLEELPIESYSLAIRPEHVLFSATKQEGIPARVEQVVELGAVREMHCRLQDETMMILHRPWHEPLPAAASEIWLQLPVQHLRALPERCDRAQVLAASHQAQTQRRLGT